MLGKLHSSMSHCEYILSKVSLNRNTQNKANYWLIDENVSWDSQEPNPIFPLWGNESVFTNLVIVENSQHIITMDNETQLYLNFIFLKIYKYWMNIYTWHIVGL